ncbi:hypothetical protein GW17_00033741, partial [Ensete ventricosum]
GQVNAARRGDQPWPSHLLRRSTTAKAPYKGRPAIGATPIGRSPAGRSTAHKGCRLQDQLLAWGSTYRGNARGTMPAHRGGHQRYATPSLVQRR